MNDRERLVELLNKPLLRFQHEAWENSDRIADYLIVNGVTVQKQGEWEGASGDTCSVCGEEWFDWGNMKAFQSNYCPNCGAKMDGEADGT